MTTALVELIQQRMGRLMLLSLTCQQIVYKVRVEAQCANRRHRFEGQLAVFGDNDIICTNCLLFPMVVYVASDKGSALSVIVGESVERKKHLFDTSVKLWLLREEVNGEDLADLINRQHENVKYLPGIQLPKNIVNQN
ncbi:hypothetical protein Tsp_09859 [Trichinella spiralis]|uniref:hypothetical protein n=1 Tax=Trichinella spiralis TaxID=6334 RepID=UPI0001EFDC06|nr:hypothetical protein Tsp_09859 [Trichinella spiralis]